ncbi:ABC transporter permease subunit [Romboutsia sedimentorum]|uniref:ABC transporter permease n=1 Tax=Romboutsia sedimentorum TaxID=1368474 RepID=UPI0024DF06B1|nr:ABC transporter permease subunit [Romboutsia sedimentorum]MDK2585577.1 ABC transporter permease subunit [Romboutsia sedimentorum]
MKEKLKPYILLAPIFLILFSVFSIGIIVCMLQSLGCFPLIGLNEITLDYYKEILRDTTFIKSFLFSLSTCAISSIISVVGGVMIAYMLIRDNKYSKFRKSLIRLPIIIPHIVVVLLIFMVFSQSGVIARILYNIGFINDTNDFSILTMDKNGIGVILVYIYKGIPFIAFMTFSILKNFSDNLESVAMNLGASKSQAFFNILLPLSMPTIISSFIIIFAFSFGSFEVPYLIGPTTPRALPVEAYIRYSSSDLTQRPYAMAINVILTTFSFVLLIIYNKLLKKIYKYKL